MNRDEMIELMCAAWRETHEVDSELHAMARALDAVKGLIRAAALREASSDLNGESTHIAIWLCDRADRCERGE